MLEIRYNKSTKEITGWWGSRHGNQDVKLKNRPDEVMIILDVAIPDKPSEAWLYDEATESLVSSPAFSEPGGSRDLAAEIDNLRARLDIIESSA